MSRTSIKTSVATAPAKPVLVADVPRRRVREEAFPLKALKSLASLRLTVVLFALSILLVFFGTLAQVDAGIWTVMKQYFRSLYVWVPFQVFAHFGEVFFGFLGFPRNLTLPGGFPFFGGWSLGTLLLINLLAAHAVRFKFTWKRSGVLILHTGVIILMLGELVTGLFAVEGVMIIPNKQSANYLLDQRAVELAVVDPSDPKTDDVAVIPGKMLGKGGLIHDDQLPFDVQVEQYMVNSARTKQAPPRDSNLATAGAGLSRGVVEASEVSGTDPNQKVDTPSAYLTFKKKDTGESLGTYLVSLHLSDPQSVTVGDKTYEVSLRFKQTYKPYTIHLLEFRHDVFPGTDTPKNYSSLVRLSDPAQGEDRETLIRMNEPLRYQGETFYQSSFLEDDAGTILQVVRNPGWLMPYVSCVLVGVGMLVHFGITLVGFLKKEMSKQMHQPEWSGPVVYVPLLGAGIAALCLAVVAIPLGSADDKMNLEEFGRIPVLNGGRVMPMDSLARNSLMVINGGRQTYRTASGEERPAVQWLLDVMVSNEIFKKDTAEKHRVICIENDQVLKLLGLKPREGRRYAIDEFRNKIDQLDEKANLARDTDPKQRDLFQTKILELAQHMHLYLKLAHYQEPLLVPPADGSEDWQPLGAALATSQRRGDRDSDAFAFSHILLSYADGDVKAFNKEVQAYGERLAARKSVQSEMAGFEVFYNQFAPIYCCMFLYGFVGLFACMSWVIFPRVLSRMALVLGLLTLTVHTFALIARMIIQGRPPVTNLYSSAVFIGWGCVVVALLLEIVYRRAIYSIGNVVAAVTGLATLLVANHLGGEGDTLGMMQAVLDTNFWLATHVICITLGYSATFLAGFLAIALIVYGLATAWQDSPLSMTLNKALYGILCFATLLSFVGTVLGGIWADQSWGRFWGWDPKENGALLIVIWNALILHARWSGLVKLRGMAVLAVVGNMVTGWSWFGTNQLGVGLHAYGFNNKLATGLTIFWITQVLVIAVGLLPVRYWRSLNLANGRN